MASNDDLREVERLTSSISKMMDSISGKSDKRNRALEREASIMKSIASSVKEEEDLIKGIEALERRKGNILKSNYGVNQSLKSDLLKMNQVSIDSLNIKRRELQILKRVNDISSDIGDTLASTFDGFKSELEEIPILGKALSKLIPTKALNAGIENATAGFQRGFGIMFKRGLSQKKGFLKSFGGGMKAGLGQIGKSLGPLLTNPYTLAALAVAAMLGAGLVAFYKITKAAKQFREETGLLNSQTKGIQEQIQRVAMGVAPLGASMEDVAKAAAAFTNEFDGLEMASDGVLTSMVALNKNFGVGIEGGAKLNKMFTSMSDMSSDTAQHLINTTAEAADLAKVSPDKVIQDMANASEEAYNFFNGSPQALAKAAVEAAKLGTSIQQATSVARGLLDFESSITAELEASAMLGTRINFNKARALAADKDALGAQKAVVDEVAKLGDLGKISVYEMESLAKAAGMPIADLQRQIDIRQNLGELEGDQLKAAMEMIDAGKQITDISKEDLDISAQRIANQREMQSEFDNMGNELKAMGTEFLLALAPLGKLFVGIIKFAAPIAKGFFDIIGKSIGRVLAAVDNLMAPFKEIFGGESSEGLVKVLKFVGEVLGSGIAVAIGVIARVIDAAANVLGGIWKILKGIFTLDFGMIWDGIKQGLGGLLEGLFAIPLALYDTFVDLFDSLLGIFGSIGARIKAFILDLVPDWVKNLLTVGGSSPTTSGEITTTGTAVALASGGIVNGPTNALVGESGAEAVIPLNQMYAKFDEMIAAFRETKDVYMDGRKVTAGVSNNVDRIGSNSYSIV